MKRALRRLLALAGALALGAAGLAHAQDRLWQMEVLRRSATGQSGSAGSPHYGDALRDWLDARPRTLWMHWNDLAYHRAGVWEIRPRRER